MTYGIPSYKLEKDVIEAEIDVLRDLGVEIKCGVEIGKDITIKELIFSIGQLKIRHRRCLAM